MTSPASTLPRPPRADGWFARLRHAIVLAHREGYVRADLVEVRLLADIGARPIAPLPDEVRAAYRLWAGNDSLRHL